MKVFIVIECSGTPDVRKVFSTQESAESFVDQMLFHQRQGLHESWRRWIIADSEVDSSVYVGMRWSVHPAVAFASI